MGEHGDKPSIIKLASRLVLVHAPRNTNQDFFPTHKFSAHSARDTNEYAAGSNTLDQSING